MESQDRKMKKEEIANLAQLLTQMKNAIDELDYSVKKKDEDAMNAARRKIMQIEVQIDKLI